MSFAPGLPDGTTDLLLKLSDQPLIVPDELTQHIMNKSGQDAKDPDLVRLACLASQMFLASVIHDTMQNHKMKSLAPPAHLKAQGMSLKESRKVLRTEDLATALGDYGVNVKACPYFVDASGKANTKGGGSKAPAQPAPKRQ
ncbi:MAG: hypothetical protein WDW38_005343 [Sanguina aurantia]